MALAAASASTQAQEYDASSGDRFVVQQAQGVTQVSLGGTVVPYKEVTLSAQLPGRVKYLAGIEGDAFKSDDLLVELDDSELSAKRQAALAQLANADAQLRNAGVQYSRELWSPKSKNSPGGMGVPNLFDQMFTRQMEDVIGERDRDAERGADLYASQTRIQQAQNTILRVQSEIRAIDAKLRDAKSVAPFAGVIMKKFIEVGDTVQPGQPLLKYADVEYLQIVVEVPGRLRPGLSEGMMLRAELDVGSQEIPVRVAQIFPMADAQRHTVTIKFDLPQGVSAPGMYAKVQVPDFNAPTRSNPVIPSSAIRYNGSLPGVYVIGEDDKPMLRLIRVGEELPGGYTMVLSGLRAGEQVLRNPGVGVSAGWTQPQR
ncbi:efflux RND transporter periplasmic adaptor subunit [Candidatus Endoriftia persephonae]|jgi:multidrug efflux pump subunit AcrA (membrane-fusion protein)|uniref:Efflux transporter, RND family, MFP subunit n=4 Tax=Gammaproteobacteria TaxID=1236 RepID=G2FBB0_9GAMM|nr:efflux RND transporter periplasmic adaptor subunit [Candidatus Endoriftia persephone]EGW56048.1 efflux transporter, RND family, MFP subunit [endosymbiont of Tevnia jerichonana (vent Tica)]USF89192.1 efflux RND transporter periplasmic adaptor subunit [Candidatus Endoriftia persephone]